LRLVGFGLGLVDLVAKVGKLGFRLFALFRFGHGCGRRCGLLRVRPYDIFLHHLSFRPRPSRAAFLLFGGLFTPAAVGIRVERRTTPTFRSLVSSMLSDCPFSRPRLGESVPRLSHTWPELPIGQGG
jgi:hypothetical protein